MDASQQVQLTSFHLSNVALHLVLLVSQKQGSLHWNEFVKALLHRSGPMYYDDLEEALS